MAERGPRVVRRARSLRDNNPMLVACLVASFTVTLLCLYVSAYAKVNNDRRELTSIRREMRELEVQQRLLSAEVARLKQPNTILQRASALKLVPAPPEAQHLLTTPATTGVSAAPRGE